MRPRMKRYNQLLELGFLTFEARELSSVEHLPPYMRFGIRARHKLLKNHKGTKQQFIDQIKAEYLTNNWTTLTESGIPALSPWSMLREAESRYKDTHIDYVSPGVKKKRKQDDSLSSKLSVTRQPVSKKTQLFQKRLQDMQDEAFKG